MGQSEAPAEGTLRHAAVGQHTLATNPTQHELRYALVDTASRHRTKGEVEPRGSMDSTAGEEADSELVLRADLVVLVARMEMHALRYALKGIGVGRGVQPEVCRRPYNHTEGWLAADSRFRGNCALQKTSKEGVDSLAGCTLTVERRSPEGMCARVGSKGKDMGLALSVLEDYRKDSGE